MTNFDEIQENMVLCQLGPAGVTDPDILRAFGNVPREVFVPEDLRAICYADDHLHLGDGRFLMAPVMLARMIAAADIRKTDTVLCVGGGSGYAAAICAELGDHVVDLDVGSDDLYQGAARTLGLATITRMAGDLTQAPAGQSFDVILVLGAVADVPAGLVRALNNGGRLVAPVVPDDLPVGQMVVAQKSAVGQVSMRPLFDAVIEYLPGCAAAPKFKFG